MSGAAVAMIKAKDEQAGKLEWDRSETLALAQNQCATCHGAGLRLGRRGQLNPCQCVLRRIFRICFARFEKCVQQERHMSRVSMEPHGQRGKAGSWGRKDEEYIADFTLVSRRTLTEEEYRLFNYHFLLGANWKLCSRKLGMDRGNFFHAVYRVEEKLGQVFRELLPYSLFPLDEYFHGSFSSKREACKPTEPWTSGRVQRPAHLSFPTIGRQSE